MLKCAQKAGIIDYERVLRRKSPKLQTRGRRHHHKLPRQRSDSTRLMRLNTFIAHNSAYSRREADSLIAQGRVRINRQKAQLGAMITKDDKIFIDGKQLKPKKADDYTFIIYHKPKGKLVSKRDDRARRVIYDSLESRFSRIYPCGAARFFK